MLRIKQDKLYGNGFFAFLCIMVLIGVLMGTITYCFAQGDFLNQLFNAQENFITVRQEKDLLSIMTSSFFGAAVFLAAAFLCGLCPLGQPFEVILLVIKGMGIGLTLSQLYTGFGSQKMLLSIGLVVPGAVISSISLVFAVREALCLSNIYLSISISDVQQDGLRETIKLYAVKYLILLTVLAASAGIDCLCSYLLVHRF